MAVITTYSMSAAPDASTAFLMIPVVPDFVLGDWVATSAALQKGVRLDFTQPWRGSLIEGFKPGHVWLGIVGDELVTYSVFDDDAPSNRATKWDDPTWVTGDVIELFFQAEGRRGYFEFHVTPENQRLQLYFPSSEDFRAGRGHRTWAIKEPRFKSATRINDARNQWESAMRIKLAVVLDEPRADASRRFKFSFSRYDYQPGRPKPVTSATSKLSAPDFHNIPQWTWAEAARS